VRIDPCDANNLAQPQIVTAGESRRVTDDAVGNQVIMPASDALGTSAKKLLQSLDRPLRGVGVLASSEFTKLNRTASHLVNGSGLTGNAHTNLPDDTMWHTLLGRVENEYLLFDLQRAYRLASCKIWNYNEATDGLFRARGIARADIYVSATGRGNPVVDPAEWQLVTQDAAIPVADGTANYASPHEIIFDEVATRFVAVVVRAAHGHDPRYPLDAKVQCVGLAEVQFFGQPVDKR